MMKSRSLIIMSNGAVECSEMVAYLVVEWNELGGLVILGERWLSGGSGCHSVLFL